MECTKKVSSKPDVYVVNLPRKTDNIFIDIVLKTGYADETDKEFGTGHLLEHYLISSLWDDIKKNNLEINGSISLELTKYSLQSSKENYSKETAIFLERIFSPDFSEKQIFKKEKNAIINEIKTKISSPYERADATILKERFLRNCRYARSRKEQLLSLVDKSIKDIEKYYKEFYTKNRGVFFISGYKTPPRIISEIIKKIEQAKILQNSPVYKNRNFFCGYSGFKLKAVKENITGSQILISLNFPGLIAKNLPKERFLARIICKLLSATRYGLLSEIRNLGIYNMVYEETILEKAGYIAFGAISKRKNINDLLKLFCEKITELKRNGAQNSRLKKIVADMKKSATEAFDDNTERMRWVSYDLIHFGKVISPADDAKCLNKITTEEVRKMAKKILDVGKLNLLFITKNPENIKTKEIKKSLNF